ncbi:MAG: glycosyltransferase family 2 protein [Pontibacterium sp.]
MDLLSNIIGWAFLLVAAIPILYFLALTVAGCMPDKVKKHTPKNLKFAIVIPAHNETLLIEDTVKAALNQNYDKDNYKVVVIADNCTDDTAEKARNVGAHVIERSGPPGKGQALYHAFEGLLKEEWDGFLIVDADSLLHKEAMHVLDYELSNGSKVVQLQYAIRNPEDSVRTRALELGMASYNALRPKGRTMLGMSSGIFGNGFCISREALENVPYLAHSIVEDIEYHIHLLKSGYKTVFTDKACVHAEMPTSTEASETQRVRWEHGRWITIKTYAKELWKLTLKGDKCAFDGLTDVLTPPAMLTLFPLIFAALFGDMTVRLIALFLFLSLVAHYLIASMKYGSFSGLIRVGLYVPWYLVWKTWVTASSIIRNPNIGWNRTGRE